MKITRKQLRKIISEAMKVPVFDKVTPEEIEALRMKARKEAGLEDLITPEKEETLGRDSAVSIYKTFGSEEPDITQSQEDAFFAGQEQYEKNLLKDNYPGIAEMILTGDMHMLEGLKAAAKVGVLGKPIPSVGRTPDVFIGLYPRLSKRLSGVTDLNVSLKISDKDFAQALNDAMGSGSFGKAHGGSVFGKLIMRTRQRFPHPLPHLSVLKANEKNIGYDAIQYDLTQEGIRYKLVISINGSGTKESNSKLNQLHNLIDNVRRQGM